MLIHESMLKCKQYVVSAIPNQRNFLDRVLIGTLMACLLLPSLVWAQEDETDDWPREITVSEGVVVIYQPQPEKLDGDQLKVRAAVAVKFKGASEPVFGAVWLEARLETDRDGNVHRKTDQGWQERTNEGWKSEKRQPDKSQKPAQSKSSVSRPNKTQDLERSNRARQQGDKRTGSYNKARQRGGGRSGGGGRR